MKIFTGFGQHYYYSPRYQDFININPQKLGYELRVKLYFSFSALWFVLPIRGLPPEQVPFLQKRLRVCFSGIGYWDFSCVHGRYLGVVHGLSGPKRKLTVQVQVLYGHCLRNETEHDVDHRGKNIQPRLRCCLGLDLFTSSPAPWWTYCTRS